MLQKEIYVSPFAAQETFVAEAKMFPNLFRNIFRPQQMFPRLQSGNNVFSFTGAFRLQIYRTSVPLCKLTQ